MEAEATIRQEIKDAVADEDYELAGQLKKQLQVADQVQAAKAQIAAAVEAEDYEKAAQLKKQLTAGPQAAASNSPTSIKFERVRDIYLDNTASHSLVGRKVLLIGKTGVGKSSLGNLIAGKEVFTSSASFSSCTKEVKAEYASVAINGQHFVLSVVDTPGFKDTDDLTDERLMMMLYESLAAENTYFNMIMFVAGLGRYTDEEEDVMRRIMNFFGDAIRPICHVVFTHCEGINFDHCNRLIDEEMQTNPRLKAIYDFCEGKVHCSGVIPETYEEDWVSPGLLKNIQKYQDHLRSLMPISETIVSMSLTKFHRLREEEKLKFILGGLRGEDVNRFKLVDRKTMESLIEMHQALQDRGIDPRTHFVRPTTKGPEVVRPR